MKHLKREQFDRFKLLRRIEHEMIFREISQKELAKMTGIDPSNLCRILKGVTCPSLDIFIRICNALYLNISLGYLR